MAHGDKNITKEEFIKQFPDEDPEACNCHSGRFKTKTSDLRIIIPDHEDRIAELEKKIEKLST
jgi:hypothetical protein|tara:strand:+ start:1385 stop:1573 length:189 start_codon:yes stop_codon:yes gene_type:complete